MDRRTGRIYTDEEMKKIQEVVGKPLPVNRFFRMTIPPTPGQLHKSPPRVGRNDCCPCGSGKKFKHCHKM